MYRLMLRFATLLTSLALALSAFLAPVTTQSVHAATQPVTDLEFIRNGTFDWYREYGEPTAWKSVGTGSGVQETSSADGGPAMNLQGISEYAAYVYQELRLPTTTTGASVSADFRNTITGSTSSAPGFAVAIMTDPADDNSALAVLYSEFFIGETGWQQVGRPLTANEVTNIQNAHSAGQTVFMVFKLYQNDPAAAQAWVDNVSVRVTGSRDMPSMQGSIAYVGFDTSGNHISVKRIAPDGSGDSTVWPHPSKVPLNNRIADVAWAPDTSEIAFSSNHEIGYSAFHSDVFGIAPGGGTPRRITNPPGQSALTGGGLQFGKVRGQIRNDYGTVTTFQIYIEGAMSPVSVDIGSYGSTVGFPEMDVADLGTGLHYVVFAWSKDSHTNCRTYAPAIVDVDAGKTLDAGTLSFDGAPCGEYRSESVSWRGDGTKLAVDVLAPRSFASAGEAIGTSLFSVSTFADDAAWSPTSDEILYRNYTGDVSTSGIYKTTVGGDAGSPVVPSNGALWYTPAWLPDGSGFVYTRDNEIRQYLFAGDQDTLLASFYDEFVYNPSVSPDGKYVVFEWQESYVDNSTAHNNHNLWVLDRFKPTEMWPLTTDNRSANPDWSRSNVRPIIPCTPVNRVTIQGPDSGGLSQNTNFSVVTQPANATPPLTIRWDPIPNSGQSTANAIYHWSSTGIKTIWVHVSNCGTSSASDNQIISIDPTAPLDRTYLPSILR